MMRKITRNNEKVRQLNDISKQDRAARSSQSSIHTPYSVIAPTPKELKRRKFTGRQDPSFSRDGGNVSFHCIYKYEPQNSG